MIKKGAKPRPAKGKDRGAYRLFSCREHHLCHGLVLATSTARSVSTYATGVFYDMKTAFIARRSTQKTKRRFG
jgi:hypothetical protein